LEASFLNICKILGDPQTAGIEKCHH